MMVNIPAFPTLPAHAQQDNDKLFIARLVATDKVYTIKLLIQEYFN